MSYVHEFVSDVGDICGAVPESKIKKMVEILKRCREKKGRLFILGVGGSAATASHAVNDFRKICCMEAYTPTDNVAEITARTNDDGWDSIFAAWLKTNRLSSKDVVLVFSVGGGQVKGLSGNLTQALMYASDQRAWILGFVGRDGGFTAKAADVCVIFETLNDDFITPYVESAHGVMIHLLVSHPDLKLTETAWESKKLSF